MGTDGRRTVVVDRIDHKLSKYIILLFQIFPK